LNRSHNQTSLQSFLPNFSTLVDTVSFKKYFKYTLNTELNPSKSVFRPLTDYNFFNENRDFAPLKNNSLKVALSTYLDTDLLKSRFSALPFLQQTVSNNMDVASSYNSVTYLLNSNFLKRNVNAPYEKNTFGGELERGDLRSVLM
jgi:hypothetical protein